MVNARSIDSKYILTMDEHGIIYDRIYHENDEALQAARIRSIEPLHFYRLTTYADGTMKLVDERSKLEKVLTERAAEKEHEEEE